MLPLRRLAAPRATAPPQRPRSRRQRRWRRPIVRAKRRRALRRCPRLAVVLAILQRLVDTGTMLTCLLLAPLAPSRRQNCWPGSTGTSCWGKRSRWGAVGRVGGFGCGVGLGGQGGVRRR